MSEIERLRVELRAAEVAEAAQKEERRKNAKAIFRFSVQPVILKRWDYVFDESCSIYRIIRECENPAEMKAAGQFESYYQNGGMNYYYNSATKKLIASVGGGYVFLENNTPAKWAAVSAFIAENPQGGDITHILK
jgi:hypothetical protein